MQAWLQDKSHQVSQNYGWRESTIIFFSLQEEDSEVAAVLAGQVACTLQLTGTQGMVHLF